MRIFRLSRIFQGGVVFCAIGLLTLPALAKQSENEGAELFPVLEGIEIVSEQEAQINESQQDTWNKVKSILTPLQLETFHRIREQGGSLREGVVEMNLSSEQKRQLLQLFHTNNPAISEFFDSMETDIVSRSVPEPTSTLALLALGTLGIGSALKRKLKQYQSASKVR